MDILERTYDFDCPKCYNALRAKPEDIRMDNLWLHCKCPTCGKKIRVFKTSVTIRTVMP